VRLNYGVSIGAMGSVRIGDRTRIGPYVMIIDTEFHDVYDRDRMPEPRPVVIEEDVWIGAKASIMPGVTIGRGAVVGVSSVVSTNVQPHAVVVGIPAREVKKLDPSRFAKPRAAP
jgi:acetyltransferase-like isoleucine patch superfamily enzyme